MQLPRVVVQNRWAWCLSAARLSWAFAVAAVDVATSRDRDVHDRRNHRNRRLRRHRRRRHLDVDTRQPNR